MVRNAVIEKCIRSIVYKENLQKQFQDNSTTYSPEELKKIQKQFIDRVKSVEHQYPLSYIVSDDEKQTSMKYEKWYDTYIKQDHSSGITVGGGRRYYSEKPCRWNNEIFSS